MRLYGLVYMAVWTGIGLFSVVYACIERYRVA